MNRNVTLTAIISLTALLAGPTRAEDPPVERTSVVLAAMAEGIGDLTYASPEWVEVAKEAMSAAATKYADGLKDLGQFTLCEVGHNAPAYLHAGSTLAWHVKFDGSSAEVHTGELPAEECGLKIQADHSILSNLARIQYHGNDPEVVAAARARLRKLSRWKIDGKMPAHKVLRAVLRSMHDSMAVRTMPRFVFMTPEWVSSARHIVSTRARMPEHLAGIRDVEFTFAEEFTDTPHYAFPDGTSGGFWVRCDHGHVTVGAGPLPEELEPADSLLKGPYTPVVPVGRTVNAAMTDEEKAEQAAYLKAAFAPDEETKKPIIGRTSPTGKTFPPGLGRVMMVLHDELSKRTSGELPSDFDKSIKPQWATPQKFDRHPDYDPSWIRYDRFDVYGNPRGPSIRGVVTYKGPQPEPRPIQMKVDPACVALHGAKPVLDEHTLVSSSGHLKNVFVYVKKVEKGDFPIPDQPARLDQKGCMYRPRVLGVRVGQTLQIVNSDALTHNVRSYARRNRAFNIGQPGPGTREKKFRRPEPAVKVQCDIHPWMAAYLFVMDHPFFAVSDDSGSFAIDGLPAGKHTLVAWHEKLGKQETEITVTGKATEVNFEFQAAKK